MLTVRDREVILEALHTTVGAKSTSDERNRASLALVATDTLGNALADLEAKKLEAVIGALAQMREVARVMAEQLGGLLPVLDDLLDNERVREATRDMRAWLLDLKQLDVHLGELLAELV